MKNGISEKVIWICCLQPNLVEGKTKRAAGIPRANNTIGFFSSGVFK